MVIDASNKNEAHGDSVRPDAASTAVSAVQLLIANSF